MKRLSILIIIVFLVSIAMGCGGGTKMHQSKDKNRAGLPNLKPQIDETARHGKSIKITEEISYPGMTPYQGASYEFTSTDNPETVAAWFDSNLPGSTMNKRTSSQKDKTKWEIVYKKYLIDLYYFSGEGTLIRYKKNMDYQELEEK